MTACLVSLTVSEALTKKGFLSASAAVAVEITAVVLIVISICFIAKIEYATSAYICQKCGHEFSPTFLSYALGAHTLGTRRLTCPLCGQKSWCARKAKSLKGEKHA